MSDDWMWLPASELLSILDRIEDEENAEHERMREIMKLKYQPPSDPRRRCGTKTIIVTDEGLL